MSSLGRCVVIAVAALTLQGCDVSTGRSLHARLGWKAEDYFENKLVIQLCQAIEADNLPEIERLVAEGADVNAKGKGGMTPLLWAYPDNHLERFTKLLTLGADPNVTLSSDVGTRGQIRSGE